MTACSTTAARRLRRSLGVSLFAIAAGLIAATTVAAPALAADVTWTDIANDAKTNTDVLMYGMGIEGKRFSTLKQIDESSVSRLVPAWSFSFGDEKQRGQETQALVHDGIVYVTASYSRMFALDAKSGKRLWSYAHRLPDDIRPCCDVVNRGAAIYGDKVFMGTLDASIVALNKNTGKVVWKQKFADHKVGYTMTGAPTIVKDQKTGKVLLIHGSSGDEFGVVGRLYARDPDTGEEVWMRPMVEGHMGRLNGKDSTITGNPNAPSWPRDKDGKLVEAWSHGGGAPWQSATFDLETNTIVIGTGNPAPWNGWARWPGDSLYTSGQAYVDPTTGDLKGFYQHTPNDAWDFSGNNELVLFDYTDAAGKTIKATGHADRNGFFYVTDRNKLANAGGEANKPNSVLAAYPFVDGITWAKGIDLKTGRPSRMTANARPCRSATKSAARRWRSRPPSWAARTGTRCPTARTPSCSTSPPTIGRRITGPSMSATTPARPISAWGSASTSCSTTMSAPCARSIPRPARSSGSIRKSCRCGPARWRRRAI